MWPGEMEPWMMMMMMMMGGMEEMSLEGAAVAVPSLSCCCPKAGELWGWSVVEASTLQGPGLWRGGEVSGRAPGGSCALPGPHLHGQWCRAHRPSLPSPASSGIPAWAASCRTHLRHQHKVSSWRPQRCSCHRDLPTAPQQGQQGTTRDREGKQQQAAEPRAGSRRSVCRRHLPAGAMARR